MKRNIVFKTLPVIATAVFLCGGCHPGTEEEISGQTTSQLIVKAESKDVVTRSADGQDVVVFTGNDILWFNESTREIRFRDN